MVADKDVNAIRNDQKNREVLATCMAQLGSLEDPDDARRVVRTLAVWFEDPEDRANLADSILESLGEIGQAIRDGIGGQ